MRKLPYLTKCLKPEVGIQSMFSSEIYWFTNWYLYAILGSGSLKVINL